MMARDDFCSGDCIIIFYVPLARGERMAILVLIFELAARAFGFKVWITGWEAVAVACC